MQTEPNFHHVAAAMADARRSRMLCTLMDGRAFTAKELACDAGITPQTASAHLGRLKAAGLIHAEKSGRHVYHRLAGVQVAEMLESLGCLSPLDHLQRARKSCGARREGADALFARCCYSHLAGELGVMVHDAMRARALLVPQGEGLRLSAAGQVWAVQHGFRLRAGARRCLDWSERRHHLAGPLAIDLLAQMFAREWVVRAKTGRALILGAAGRAGFEEAFGLHEV